MKALSDLVKRFQRGYTDVVGVDIGSTAIKAVRLRAVNREPVVVAAALLPPPKVAITGTVPVVPLDLPKPLKARYAALAYSDPSATVKLITFPAHSEKSADAQVNEMLGLSEGPDFRVAYEKVSESRTESRVLAVSVPDAAGARLCALLPSGVPAPCSLEVSGLASMTSFERGPGRRHAEEAVAAIDFGAVVTTVAFYSKRSLLLIRKFDVGTMALLKRVQDTLGIDADVALGIMTDGSFDVSAAVHQSLESFLQQLIISRDFVERRENCHISRLYVCGGAAPLKGWSQQLQSALGLEPEFWNPFADLTVQPGALPDAIKGQESRFAAALGAAWAVLAEE